MKIFNLKPCKKVGTIKKEIEDAILDGKIENNYDDLITVNNEYKRSGSVRIFKYEYLKAGLVSKRMGCIRDDATDIHYREDLLKIRDEVFKGIIGHE